MGWVRDGSEVNRARSVLERAAATTRRGLQGHEKGGGDGGGNDRDGECIRKGGGGVRFSPEEGCGHDAAMVARAAVTAVERAAARAVAASWRQGRRRGRHLGRRKEAAKEAARWGAAASVALMVAARAEGGRVTARVVGLEMTPNVAGQVW